MFLPAYLPAVIFRFHLLTYQLYLALVSLEETFAYSGYNVLPSGLILGGMARRQERHLMSTGEGNFGCFGALDFALGTSLGQDVVEDVTEEVENEIQRERGKSGSQASPKRTSRGREPKKPQIENGDEGGETKKKASRGRRPKHAQVESGDDDEEVDQHGGEAESPKRRTRGSRRARS